MKRLSLLTAAFLMIGLLFGAQAMAQGRIDLNAAKTTQECKNVKLNGFSASFSYSSIESQIVNTEKGVFSAITMGNSVAAGNIGDPQVPVTRKLIAVPFGATPVVTVKNYTVEEYNLADFGIERLYPQQASVSKSNNNPKFAYNEAAYSAKGFDESRPIAEVTVMGTMRGIQLGALQLNTLRYNASANTIRVYNNVEVEVSFKDADLDLTEKTLVNTYSPYFRTVYSSLFNERAITDIYDQHPDLWAVPVRILVVANRMFEEAMQPWITWKTEKGFYMDVNYTDQIGTSAAAIKSFIVDKYNEGLAAGQTPTFLIIVGDSNKVPQSQMGTATSKVTDLYYYAVAGGANDFFPDMFHSRFTCETVQEFQNVLDKSMMYEQYTMPDPSYLNNVLLIAGWDGTWNPRVGKPTIQYAMNYYYNADHGFDNVYNWLEQPYTGCYQPMNTGVNFVNYTAHGDNTMWADPEYNTSNVNSLTNTNKYFLAMGNCCLAANWGYSSKSLGEAMIIAQNKGAYAYIGSPVETYWYEDYYFGVGATNTFNQMPLYENTTMGVYDATFTDEFNSISAIPFIGNVAVAYSHANGYQGSVSDQYYWEAYHVLGDGSVCPYHTNPIANTVSHLATLPIGMDTYTVTADPGSYVGISKDGVLYGAGEIGEEGTADIPITPITSGGEAKIVVTHPQRQPYIATVPTASMEGPYIAVDSYTPTNVHVGDESHLSITFKNVGAAATTGTTNVTLSCGSSDLTIINGTGSIASLAPDATATVNGFSYRIATGVADGTRFTIVVSAVCGSETWENKIYVTAGEAVLAFDNMSWGGSFVPGETVSVIASFKNIGHYLASNAIARVSSTSPYVSFVNNTFNAGTINPEGTAMCVFDVTISATCPETEQLPLTFTLTADGDLSAEGSASLSNSCKVVFDLSDSYGDGWDNSKLTVSFSDSTPSQDLTVSTSSATYVIEVGNGVEVTLRWTSGSWYDSECSIHVYYEDGDDIYSVSNPSSGVLYTFVCSCGGGASAEIFNPVQNLNAEIDGTTVKLAWAQPIDGTPANYIVYRNGIEIGQTSEMAYTDEVNEDMVYTYCVVAKYSNGTSTPSCVSVEYLTIDESEVEFAIYPNPVNNTLYVNGDNVEYSYQMFNGMGQKVVEGKAIGNAQINVSNMTKGVYFLRLTSGTQVRVEKVVVE
ncbi:MAG: T9SS type A sorting domain-containing protein [Bacteroidales bacterium]|nr:T9SS type A sorting domain-containing protein [Bacteroidales bacterium]